MRDISWRSGRCGCSNLANPSRLRNKNFPNPSSKGMRDRLDFCRLGSYLDIFSPVEPGLEEEPMLCRNDGWPPMGPGNHLSPRT